MNNPPEASTIHVRTLLGHAQVPLAIRCLSSLARTSAEKLDFIIHEDGSLNGSDIDLLRSKLPVSAIITRQEADDLVLPQLQKHPASVEYRKASPLGLKLFDIALLEKAQLNFCDSDILFLLPHTGLFQGILNDKVQSVFMQDCRESYALRPWAAWPLGRQKLVSRLNSGLFAIAPGAFDLDFVHHFLRDNWPLPAFQRRLGWGEQTCWAALAARLKTRIYDPRQIAIAHPGLTRADHPVAIHFVSTYRDMIQDYVDPSTADGTSTPQRIRTINAKTAHAFRLISSEARAQINRRVHS